jgi:hypothetical protein
MLQFYFLSITLNLLAGIGLLAMSRGERFPQLRAVVSRRSVKIGLGGAAMVVGVLKLFVRAPIDTVAVAGDLLPALVGIAAGLALIADPYAADRPESEEAAKIRKITSFYRIPLAVLALGTAVVHFFVPGAVIV